MKTTHRVSPSVLALLFAVLAPLAIGCAASSGEETPESTDSTHEALMNNGGSPDRDLEDLKKDGYDCGPVDGTTVCTKNGSPTYYCYSNGRCTAGLTTTPKPPIYRGPPVVVAPIKAAF